MGVSGLPHDADLYHPPMPPRRRCPSRLTGLPIGGWACFLPEPGWHEEIARYSDRLGCRFAMPLRARHISTIARDALTWMIDDVQHLRHRREGVGQMILGILLHNLDSLGVGVR